MSTRTGFGKVVRRTSRRSATSFFALLLLFSLAMGQGTGMIASAGGLGGSLQPASGGQKATDLLKNAKSVISTTAAPRVTTAADAINVDLDQYANLPGKGWQNGDLNGNNSAYGEGMVVPFRLALEGISAGQHTIHLNHDFLSGSSEAYDFLATWNVTENPDKCASGGGAVSSHCPSTLGAADTHAFPGDSFSPAVSPGLTVNGAMTFANVSRNLTMYGGTIDSIGAISHGSGKADMTVTFTTTSTWAFFLWGAHIAQSAYWNEFNGGDANGAATISGAPWHMRTQQLDGSGNKNQDRSIQPSAISVAQPNVRVTKVADDASISAGDTAGFTVTVTNDGPGAASDVTLTDPLPAGVSWSFDQVTGGWTCGIASGTLTCGGQGFTLDEGASASVHVYGVTGAADCGTLTNTATVSASNEAADSDSDNSATATITVNCASIGISKTADAGTVVAGSQIGYTITVTNGGAGTAHGVTMTDTLPSDPGLSWSVGTTTGGWSCSITSGVLTCGGVDFDLGPSASASVHITSPTTAATCGTVDNTAHVATSNDGSGNASASITVNCPNVSVLKTAANGTINAGDTASFTIVVSSDGTGTATGVTLNDPLPAGISWTEDSPFCDIAAGVLTCDFGDMAAGTSHTVHVSGLTDATDCGTLTNTATVSADNEAPGSGQDNTSTATITVNCPDVTVVKTADQGTINAGDTASFTIVVSNDGAGTATGVTLNDPLPAGISWTEDSPFCDIAAGVLTCDFGDMAAGTSHTVHVSGLTDATDCGDLVNTATVAASNEADGDTGNNTSTATITVNCPGINITKVADDPQVDAADQIGFTITVSNGGPGTAADVMVTDTLPTNDGLSWSIDGGTGAGDCAIDQGVLTCDFGDMAAGTSFTVHITSDTDATTCGTVDNTATVTISNGPGDEDGDSVDVNCPPLGIDIVKGGPGLAHVGDTIVYTFTVQLTTPETLFDIVVSDPNCNEGAPVYVSGDDGDNALEAGEVWHYTCTHVVTQTDPDPLPNTATVQGTADDGRSASDQDSHSVDLIHPDIRIVKTVNPDSGEPGDTVTYTYVVTNTGDTTLYDISVDDDVIGHIGDIDQLAPGESATLTMDFVLPNQQGDLPLVNVGTGTGTDVLGSSVSDQDEAGVTILRAETPPPSPPTAFTGSDAERIGLIAAGLLALGLLALALGRRRRGQTA